jgi:phage terminase large subunit-like protein
MVTKLMEHSLKMVEFRQNIQTFNEPQSSNGRRGRIRAWRHPCSGPCPAATIKIDVNENIRPVKDRNTGRIDGIVALIMALSRAIRRQEPSEYPGVFVLNW